MASPLLEVAAPAASLTIGFYPSAPAGQAQNDFWAFFEHKQQETSDSRHSMSSDATEDPCCPDSSNDLDIQATNGSLEAPQSTDNASSGEGGAPLVTSTSASVQSSSSSSFSSTHDSRGPDVRAILRQLSLSERQTLGPPVVGSYFHRREDAKGNKPLFSFGVITDVQYADIDDGQSFLGIPRFYRNSLEVVKQAARNWNRSPRPVSFAIHFGDIVDGFCPRERSMEAVNTVLDAFAGFKAGPTYHMIGNHCLYNLPRPTLNKLLAIPTAADHRSYYDFSPFPNFRFVVLDSYDISLLGWPPGHPHSALAASILSQRNPNDEKNSPEGLTGMERRFVQFNGGVGEAQLRWLEGVLAECDACGDVAVVCCHQPLEPTVLPTATCLVWNYEQVLSLIHSHHCVAAVLAGHAHFGAHTVDAKGIHHRVLEGAVECPPSTVAFGHIDVYSDRLCLMGTDRMMSTEMRFPSFLAGGGDRDRSGSSSIPASSSVPTSSSSSSSSGSSGSSSSPPGHGVAASL